MSTFNLTAALEQYHVVLTNSHFVYTSGRHGHTYINKDALYPHTALMQQIGVAMGAAFAPQTDVVVGPTIGGVVLSQWIAHALSHATGRAIPACFAEERTNAADGKERYLGRGYDAIVVGKRVLVVEDILTTGGSVRQTVDAVRRAGGTPIAVSAVCNRGGVTDADVGHVPLHALLSVQFDSWDAADCPLCRAGVAVNTAVGKGAAFVKSRL